MVLPLREHETRGVVAVHLAAQFAEPVDRPVDRAPLFDDSELAEYHALHDATLIEATGIEQLPTVLRARIACGLTHAS